MVSTAQRPKIIAIVGPTASGKSDLAMRLAREFDGEIICADSRTIYQGMDIGTAKPTNKELTEVKHWGLNLLKPGESYSAGKFKKYAQNAIKDIQKRGKLAILVGGTGLYIDGVLYDYQFSLAAKERDPVNPRHLKKGTGATKSQLLTDTLLVGLLPPDDAIKRQIAARTAAIFKSGIINETKGLLQEYGQPAFAGTAGIAYGPVLELISGQMTRQEAQQAIQTKEWQYARRQKTWFRRNPNINWFNDANQAHKYVQKQLLNT